MKTHTTKPLVAYYINEADMQKLERESTKWKRAALRLARMNAHYTAKRTQAAVDAVRKLNGGKL